MRVLAAAKPWRNCLFVAMSDHELGFLGIDPYLKRRSDLIKRAKAWIFFGSDIGAPRQPSLIHAPDDALEQWAVNARDISLLITHRYLKASLCIADSSTSGIPRSFAILAADSAAAWR